MAVASLVDYDSKRFAVCLPLENQPHIFRGLAQYAQDTDLGPILRIEIASPGETGFAIIVEQARWQGSITPDREHGCDFFLNPTHAGG